MDAGTTIGLSISLVVLIMFSAYFSATETAFTGFSAVRLKTMAERKKGAKLALKLAENYDRVLSTLLIGNNIVNISSASIATIMFTSSLGEDIGATVSTVVMTVLVLIFGEISPKSIAKERPESFASAAAYPLYVFTIIFYPLNLFFDAWKKLINKVFKLGKKQPTLTEEELKIIVTDIKNEGVLNQMEHDLIHNSISFDDKLVSAVMTPANKIMSVRASDETESIKEVFTRSNFSRIPVYDKHGEEILGILYRADFYELMIVGNDDIDSVFKPAMRTSGNRKISELFKEMQKNKQHMAIVEDSGEVRGLITMEDILEELVGDMDDKYDMESYAQNTATNM